MEPGPLTEPEDWSRRFFANAAQANCFHLTAEPVTTVDRVHVGYLCPDCDAVLGADWDGVRQTPESHTAAVMITAGFDPADAIEATRPPIPADAAAFANILQRPERLAPYFGDEARTDGTLQAFADAYRECVQDRAEKDKDHPSSQCPSRVEITALRDGAARYVHGNCQPKEAY